MVTELRQQKDRERKSRTREALLQAAVEVFSERGYHNTLISDIVAHAGVGQGTFYRSFDNKRDLLEELLDGFVERLFEQFSEMTRNVPGNGVEYRAASIDAVERMAHLLRDNRAVTLLLLRESASVDEAFAAKFSEIFNRFADLARLYLDHAIAGGFARRCDSVLVSQALVGIGLRMLHLWLDGELTGDVGDMIREIVDFTLLGFGVPDASSRGDVPHPPVERGT